MPDVMHPLHNHARDSRLALMLEEVELLLAHLQRLPETRLVRYFGGEARERQKRDSTPVPPTWDLVYFLDRLAAISCSAIRNEADGFTVPRPPTPSIPPAPVEPEQLVRAEDAAKSGRPLPAPPPDSPHDPGPDLNDLAFLVWSRDFLAAITYPASVESIRVTQAFRVARMTPWTERYAARLSRIRLAFKSGRTRDAHAPSPGRDGYLGDQAKSLERYGARLARRTLHLVLLTLFFIALSVWSSFMVFSGRVLIRENDALRAARTELTQRMTLAEKDDRQQLAPLYGNTAAAIGADYCTLSDPDVVPAQAGKADTGPILFSLTRQHRLCREAKTLDQRELELKRMHQMWVASARPLAVVLMLLPSGRLTPDMPCFDKPQNEQSQCMRGVFESMDLSTHRYGMEQMVDGLIGAILPVAYSCLGALAALFRKIGMKVDAETLSPADYGGLRTSIILGVLTGTVIGLFSDFLGAGSTANSIPLGTTALALVAGFAADRVFVMFDNLAERIFGRSLDAAESPAAGKAKPG